MIHPTVDIHTYLKPGVRVHLAGIGGVSMCPLAEVLRGMGLTVQGSDMSESDTVRHLRSLGIDVAIGHSAENLKDCDLVIRTAAIHDENPEISGFSSWMAAVRITRSQSLRFSAEWPMATSMPSERRCRTVSLSDISEPCTVSPMPRSTSASGHMDTPPMPARWTRTPGLRYVWISTVGWIIFRFLLHFPPKTCFSASACGAVCYAPSL